MPPLAPHNNIFQKDIIPVVFCVLFTALILIPPVMESSLLVAQTSQPRTTEIPQTSGGPKIQTISVTRDTVSQVVTDPRTHTNLQIDRDRFGTTIGGKVDITVTDLNTGASITGQGTADAINRLKGDPANPGSILNTVTGVTLSDGTQISIDSSPLSNGRPDRLNVNIPQGGGTQITTTIYTGVLGVTQNDLLNAFNQNAIPNVTSSPIDVRITTANGTSVSGQTDPRGLNTLRTDPGNLDVLNSISRVTLTNGTTITGSVNQGATQITIANSSRASQNGTFSVPSQGAGVDLLQQAAQNNFIGVSIDIDRSNPSQPRVVRTVYANPAGPPSPVPPPAAIQPVPIPTPQTAPAPDQPAVLTPPINPQTGRPVADPKDVTPPSAPPSTSPPPAFLPDIDVTAPTQPSGPPAIPPDIDVTAPTQPSGPPVPDVPPQTGFVQTIADLIDQVLGPLFGTTPPPAAIDDPTARPGTPTLSPLPDLPQSLPSTPQQPQSSLFDRVVDFLTGLFGGGRQDDTQTQTDTPSGVGGGSTGSELDGSGLGAPDAPSSPDTGVSDPFGGLGDFGDGVTETQGQGDSSSGGGFESTSGQSEINEF